MFATILLLLMGVNVQVSQAGAERTVSVEVGESFALEEASAVITFEGVKEREEGPLFTFFAQCPNGGWAHVQQWEGEPITITRLNEPTVSLVPIRSQGPDCRAVVKLAENDRKTYYGHAAAIASESIESVLRHSDEVFMWWPQKYPACVGEPEFTPERRRRWETDGLPQKTGRGIKRLFRWLKS